MLRGIDEKCINTAYPKSEAVVYDQKRFLTPRGQLFNKLEMHQLERVLQNLPPRQRILEVGCGTGRFMVKCLQAGHEVHGLDPSPWMLEECSKKTSNFKQARYFLAEGYKLPFRDNQFSFVYSIRALNHVSSEPYALDMIREMIRVCGNGGIILLEFVNKWSLSLRRYRCVRLSVNDIKSVIKEYKNVEVGDISGVLFFTQTLMNLTPVFLLGVFERIDNLFCRMFPAFSTRCYVTLQKKTSNHDIIAPNQEENFLL